jgi:hypothetical protein
MPKFSARLKALVGIMNADLFGLAAPFGLMTFHQTDS